MADEQKKSKKGRKKTGHKGEQISYYLSPQLIRLLKEEAEKQMRSASAMLAFILSERYRNQIEAEKTDDKEEKKES